MARGVRERKKGKNSNRKRARFDLIRIDPDMNLTLTHEKQAGKMNSGFDQTLIGRICDRGRGRSKETEGLNPNSNPKHQPEP